MENVSSLRQELKTIAQEGDITFLREARRVFNGLNGLEGRHITQALSVSNFPFDRAQAELGDCFREFATVGRRVLTQRKEKLSQNDHNELEELVFLAERAPLTKSSSLHHLRSFRTQRGGLICSDS